MICSAEFLAWPTGVVGTIDRPRSPCILVFITTMFSQSPFGSIEFVCCFFSLSSIDPCRLSSPNWYRHGNVLFLSNRYNGMFRNRLVNRHGSRRVHVEHGRVI